MSHQKVRAPAETFGPDLFMYPLICCRVVFVTTALDLVLVLSCDHCRVLLIGTALEHDLIDWCGR